LIESFQALAEFAKITGKPTVNTRAAVFEDQHMHLLSSRAGLLQKGLKLVPTATAFDGRLQLPGDVIQTQSGTSCDAKGKIIG
jgi:hypothetical protein